MEQYGKLSASVLTDYPEKEKQEIYKTFLKELEGVGRKIVVLDDDPTGTQTVHDLSVYTDWSRESMEEGMREENPMFFILTNSRSLTEEETFREHKLLAKRAVCAAKACGKRLLLVSRGDSTLRGHFILEPEALRQGLEEETGKKIDGQIFCPFFREGGRYTIDSVHYVREGEKLVPAAQTEFAQDKTFGYSASHLGEYIEEKSLGTYKREDGLYITLPLLRGRKYDEITSLLLKAEDFQPVLVDAIAEGDIQIFATCLFRAVKAGKEFLIRSAAALPKVLGNVSNRPLLGREELLNGGEQDRNGGIVFIGSHVKKTTAQMEALRESQAPLDFLEFCVEKCLKKDGIKMETARLVEGAQKAIKQGRTAVVYTSRELFAPEDMTKEELLKLSVEISEGLTGVAAGLHCRPKFLIAKGGITSSNVGTKALRVRKAQVLGQIKPGIPVWKTGAESKFPGMPYIIFPGNVGDADTLRKIVEMLA